MCIFVCLLISRSLSLSAFHLSHKNVMLENGEKLDSDPLFRLENFYVWPKFFTTFFQTKEIGGKSKTADKQEQPKSSQENKRHFTLQS